MALADQQLRHRIDPRDVPPVKAARRLGLTLAAFEKILQRLLARGFPAPDPDTGHFDMKAVEVWMDERSDLTVAATLDHARVSLKSKLAGWNGGQKDGGR